MTRIVTLALIALLALCTDAQAFTVIGFQEEGTPAARIDHSAKALTTVGVDGINLTSGGAAVGAPDGGALSELAAARRDGLPADLLVGNYSSAINDFSEPLAFGLLGSPAHIAAVTHALVATVAAQGWNGITLDLESLIPRDTAGLTALVQSLRAALPAGVTLSICLQNAGNATGFAAQGYDLAAIGASVDRVILMAYDDHGPWENTPGPIGPLRWQSTGLNGLMRTVPAAKIELGVAGYGYGWRPHANLQYSDAQARRIVAHAGVHARWVPAAGEWTATLPDGSTLWWSDARSLALRVALARRDRLDGVAVWSLGLSDVLHV